MNEIERALHQLRENSSYQWGKYVLFHKLEEPRQPLRRARYSACATGYLALANGLTAPRWINERAAKDGYLLSAQHFISKEAIQVVAKVIEEQFPERCIDGWGGEGLRTTPQRVIVVFNDHNDTTQADVELVFEKAALLLGE